MKTENSISPLENTNIGYSDSLHTIAPRKSGAFICYNFSMKLIIGLGNPGSKYNFTRHNAGFLVLDFLFKKYGFEWEPRPKFDAISSKISAKEARGFLPKTDEDILFIKPQGYYNDSGRVVADFMRYYKIPASDILVICDNFDLEFGKLRLRANGSAGGNNGLKSIDKTLSCSDYPRLRIGTGNDELRRRIGDVDFVLSKFTPEEKAQLPEILSEVCEKIKEVI